MEMVLEKMKEEKKVKHFRFPRLDTILMVEEFIRAHNGEYTKRQIWQNLPKKVMYQTFMAIMDYLEYSNKIITDKNGKVVWIFDPEGIKKLIERGLIIDE